MGARILEPLPQYASVIPIVLDHHERFDGSGYPRGLSGRDISLGGRIFAVADTFDAMSSDRPYRPALAMIDVVSYIEAQAGGLFDPDVVEAFLRLVKGSPAPAAVTAGAAEPSPPGRSPARLAS